MLFQNLQGEERYYSEIRCTALISKPLQNKSENNFFQSSPAFSVV